MCRGNEPDFDDTLRWAKRAAPEQVRALFEYVAASTALTARPVRPMPELDRSRLTFSAVSGLLRELLATPSGGAHEQFAVAACLEAVIEEFGQGGPTGLRVETKPIYASDTSSKAAGDVVIRRGNRAEEAFEISANLWSEKLAQATASIRAHDLARAHIVARAGSLDAGQLAQLQAIGADVSVLDICALLDTLIGVMRKPARAHALARIHDHLDRNQPDIDRVNAYVDLLKRCGLAA